MLLNDKDLVMEMVRCVKCGGKKKLLGNGMMKRDCPDCKGSGVMVRQAKVEKKQPKIVPKKVVKAKDKTVEKEMKAFSTDDNKLVNGKK